MKKILFFAVALLYVTAANAKVWRINYDDNAQADFKTIALCQAWNGFTDGDTLYMEPGVHNGSLADNTVTKSCAILGPGWGFQSSINTISELESAVVNNSITAKGSDISVTISGVSCNSNIGSYSASKIASFTIEKCRFQGGGTWYPSADNLVIKNCMVQGFLPIGRATTATIVGNIVIGHLGIEIYS